MNERAPVEPITATATAFVWEQRARLGWTAAKLAEACNAFAAGQEPPLPIRLSRVAITKLEAGYRTSMSVSEAVVLAGAFGVPVATLLGRAEPCDEPEDALEDVLQAKFTAVEQQFSEMSGTLGITEYDIS